VAPTLARGPAPVRTQSAGCPIKTVAPHRQLSAAKASTDPATGQKALDYIAQIDKIFWETKKA
jgi:hypothetical protein